MKKFIELSHRMDDYVCMWNGVEDLYACAIADKIISESQETERILTNSYGR